MIPPGQHCQLCLKKPATTIKRKWHTVSNSGTGWVWTWGHLPTPVFYSAEPDYYFIDYYACDSCANPEPTWSDAFKGCLILVAALFFLYLLYLILPYLLS